MVVLHPLLLVGIGAASGFALVNLVWLALEVVDTVAAGKLEQTVLWPDPHSVTVWTGEDWLTATVVPIAFGRSGLAVCRDEVPRRARAVELVERARSERDARRRAHELISQALAQRLSDRVAVVAG